MKSPSSLRKVRNIADLREMARRRVPRFSFEYVDGGADDELTLAGNRAAFAGLQILPHQLAGLGEIDLSTNVLGRRTELPIAIGPTGYNGMLSRDGDLALARVALGAGIPFTQSTMSSSSIEEVASVLAGGRHWFQLYMLNDVSITERLVQRASDAGCEALVLTTDAIAVGNREGDKHNYSGPGRLAWRAKLDVAMRLPWVLDVVVPKGPPSFGNLREFLPKGQASAIDGARFISAQMDRSISWKSVEWLRSIWPGKLIVKGIMRPEDALTAAECGADAVVVSNHGGRQLDGAPSTMHVLPAIRDRLQGSCEILIDSGFRRGSDVFKALALGAGVALCGRAILFGLGAGGEAGAFKAVEILRGEFERTMILAGYGSVADVDEMALAGDARRFVND
ncbi:(S)-mandelate dehydrogenase [Pseudaminobacter salicylatoxidans]|uniref:(S)-mandelate dehydrogenase n=1 Tax=Pseudaminobacter salicylatoxidans TaxID=93369 RepID=A0A316CQR0_PSESE|nr:alpha-hydroxy acid oxidase [Pseudaminobacter salicylatoxidans]PWJ84534.1 (S)-mandelate dehydrogenase [Pseudaminobacter salicylatoxidans]